MKKNVLKIGVIVAVASAAVWNVGINETKVLFTDFFTLESMAKLETVCVGDVDKNSGICKKDINPEAGSFCARREDYSDPINCFATASYE